MKAKLWAFGVAALLACILCTSFVLGGSARGNASSGPGDPRSGEKIEKTLTCPDCSQLMTGQFRYCNTATTTVICPKCHKHWLVHYDWVNDPQSARPGHWQFMLRIISVKRS